MTKYEILNEMKSELKILANDIRKLKGKRKESPYGLVNGLFRLRYEFRHNHIAYCLMRGTSLERIELPREDNLPNETYIDSIIKERTSKITEVDDEAICVSA